MRLCELFGGGALTEAWNLGRFSADEVPKGIYRAFVMLGSPHLVIRRGAAALGLLLTPADIRIVDIRDGERPPS